MSKTPEIWKRFLETPYILFICITCIFFVVVFYVPKPLKNLLTQALSLKIIQYKKYGVLYHAEYLIMMPKFSLYYLRNFLIICNLEYKYIFRHILFNKDDSFNITLLLYRHLFLYHIQSVDGKYNIMIAARRRDTL